MSKRSVKILPVNSRINRLAEVSDKGSRVADAGLEKYAQRVVAGFDSATSPFEIGTTTRFKGVGFCSGHIERSYLLLQSQQRSF